MIYFVTRAPICGSILETVLFTDSTYRRTVVRLPWRIDYPIGGDMRACPDLSQVVKLGADRFVLRRMRPDDRCPYADFIARMQTGDLRRRFCDPSGPLPGSDFDQHALTDATGGAGFVAVRETSGSADEIVGEARLYRYPGTSAAELAIMVRSDMQRRGLGRALIRTTIDYCAAHALDMIARILPDNAAMIRLAERSGMQVEHAPNGALAIAHLRGSARGA